MTDATLRAPRGRRATAVLAVLVVAIVGGLMAWGRFGDGRPASDSPEAGFARDMSAHHAQAVQMSFIVRDRTEDEQVRLLAYDIINTQRAQIGMMTAWLDEWEAAKVDPSGPMRWMEGHGGGHSGHGGRAASQAAGTSDAPMPGMATRAQLQRLERLSGRDAEVLYLQLMTAHHRGGVDMARAILERTGHPRVRRLAQTMVSGQQSEISLMNEMLRERGARPA